MFSCFAWFVIVIFNTPDRFGFSKLSKARSYISRKIRQPKESEAGNSEENLKQEILLKNPWIDLNKTHSGFNRLPVKTVW